MKIMESCQLNLNLTFLTTPRVYDRWNVNQSEQDIGPVNGRQTQIGCGNEAYDQPHDIVGQRESEINSRSVPTSLVKRVKGCNCCSEIIEESKLRDVHRPRSERRRPEKTIEKVGEKFANYAKY